MGKKQRKNGIEGEGGKRRERGTGRDRGRQMRKKLNSQLACTKSLQKAYSH